MTPKTQSRIMKYSSNYNRDFNWYLSVRHIFTFDGKALKDIPSDKNGISGKECFYLYDSTGKFKPTKHPNIVKQLLRIKGSVNLHMKMYSEDRKSGLLFKWELEQMIQDWKCPNWFLEGINNLMHK